MYAHIGAGVHMYISLLCQLRGLRSNDSVLSLQQAHLDLDLGFQNYAPITKAP